ncbi:MAG: competence/damage-inducible protein A [Calditrichaceae bacterium]
MKNIRAEIISIGNEVLAGHTVNTNAAYISTKVGLIGLPVNWITTISDDHDEIIFALETANNRADVVLVTGGLGPTPDDITKASICEFFETQLVKNDKVLQHVQSLLQHRGLSLLESNIGQAYVPEKADILPNPIGTAPGLAIEKSGAYFFFMPGVPAEMKQLIDDQVIPYIRKKLKLPTLHNRLLRTTGIAESRLYELLKDILDKYKEFPMAFLPRHIGVDLRFRLLSDDAKTLNVFNKMVDEVRQKAAKYIFTEDHIELEEALGKILREQKFSLSCAESFTGGLIGDLVTNISGSSDYFIGGVVTYSNQSKMNLLNVKQETLKQFGAVSAETAGEMVRGVQQIFRSDCAAATTGIAGPTGGTDIKPVGLCYIAARFGDKESVKEFHFGRDRIINKRRGATAALELLRRLVLNIE